MSKILFALALGACATTGPGAVDTTPAATPTNLRLDLRAATDSAAPTFPAALAPTMPSVDRLAHAVRARLGDSATAELDLCVSPAGRVTKVALAKTSSYAAFDAALLHDAQAWRFEAMPGPASLESCRRTPVEYRVH